MPDSACIIIIKKKQSYFITIIYMHCLVSHNYSTYRIVFRGYKISWNGRSKSFSRFNFNIKFMGINIRGRCMLNQRKPLCTLDLYRHTVYVYMYVHDLVEEKCVV